MSTACSVLLIQHTSRVECVTHERITFPVPPFGLVGVLHDDIHRGRRNDFGEDGHGGIQGFHRRIYGRRNLAVRLVAPHGVASVARVTLTIVLAPALPYFLREEYAD